MKMKTSARIDLRFSTPVLAFIVG